MDLKKIKGTVESIIFQNKENTYTVALFKTKDNEIITITGELPLIKPSDNIEIEGFFKIHQNYGEQFNVKNFNFLKPETKESIYEFLSSGIIKGIGKSYAKRIVNTFGNDTLNIIENYPEKLLNVEGIGAKTLDNIITSYEKSLKVQSIIMELSKYNLTSSLAIKLYNQYKDKTLDMLKENPYEVLTKIKGIGFKKADEIALKTGFNQDDNQRNKYAIMYILKEETFNGNTYIPFEKLSLLLFNLTGHKDNGELLKILYNLCLEKEVFLDIKDPKNINVYLYTYALAESNIASQIVTLLNYKQKDKLSCENIDTLIKNKDIQFSKEQINAVKMSLENNILIITGGPGTGKTTVLSLIIEVFQSLNKTIKLAAPTGKASKRMEETTKKPASTIHRLLDIGFSQEDDKPFFGKNEENKIQGDLIIIDESSMIDVLLMDSLLKAVKKGTKLVLVGDVDQLPSVGAGNVLNDLINSKTIPTIKLTKIFRQAQKSNIVVNAHRINQGAMPLLNNIEKDFFIMERNNENEILNLLLDLILNRLPNFYKIKSEDIKVLTPMKKRTLGTLNLNKILQENINKKSPLKNEIKLKNKILRQEDLVINIKNDYEKQWQQKDKKGKGIFNGESGKIFKIDSKEKIVYVLFDDEKIASYNFDELDKLEHSFALTIHKSQGSEYDVVILPLLNVYPMLLTRKILYTGITRAKKLLIILSNNKTIEKMVTNVYKEKRYSSLKDKLLLFENLKED